MRAEGLAAGWQTVGQEGTQQGPKRLISLLTIHQAPPCTLSLLPKLKMPPNADNLPPVISVLERASSS